MNSNNNNKQLINIIQKTLSTIIARVRQFVKALYTQTHLLEILASEFSKFISFIVGNGEEVAFSRETESSTSSRSESFRIHVSCLWWRQQLQSSCSSFCINGRIMDDRQGQNIGTQQCRPPWRVLQNPTQSIQLVASMATSLYQFSLNGTSVCMRTFNLRQFGFALLLLRRLGSFRTRVRRNWHLLEFRWFSPDVQILFPSVPRERIARVEFFIADIIQLIQWLQVKSTTTRTWTVNR